MRRHARHYCIRSMLEALALAQSRKTIRKGGGGCIIFTLHHVRPARNAAFDPNAHLSITPDFLEAAISEALACGFEPVALDELPSRKAAAPKQRFVAFTLDDGCRDNRDHAAPVFRQHGIAYTLFVTKGFAQRRSTMWWETASQAIAGAGQWRIGNRTFSCQDEAGKQKAFRYTISYLQNAADEASAVSAINQAARQSGIDPAEIVARETMDETELAALAASDPLAHFGVHTLTHRNLARLPDDAAAEEITACADWIETLTGRRPDTVAYPYGDETAADTRVAAIAANRGMRLGVTTRPGRIVDIDAAPLMLPRISLNGYYQKQRYVRALLSGKLLPVI